MITLPDGEKTSVGVFLDMFTGDEDKDRDRVLTPIMQTLYRILQNYMKNRLVRFLTNNH